MFSILKATSDLKNHLMTFGLLKEHSTTSGLLNYSYFASSGQDLCEELLEYNGLVPKNDILEEIILRPSFCRYGPDKFLWVCVLESSAAYDNNHNMWQDNGKIFTLVALPFRSNLSFEDYVSVRTWCSICM